MSRIARGSGIAGAEEFRIRRDVVTLLVSQQGSSNMALPAFLSSIAALGPGATVGGIRKTAANVAALFGFGEGVALSGVGNLQSDIRGLIVRASGTPYSLTAVSASLNFGTTDPILTLDRAGTWLLLPAVTLQYNAATFAATRTVTLKLRRTNNTAADVGNSAALGVTEIITTLTYTMSMGALPPVLYTTANTDDVIEIFGDVSVVPSAGSLDAVRAQIVAVLLSPAA